MTLAPPEPPASWHARLELAYARRGDDTIPTLRRHVGPLRVQKHFAPEPGLCEHVIVHPPAGIAGGDRLAIDIALAPDANVRLTTPGATRWYRSNGPEATSTISAHLAAGSSLEFLPQEQIVFDGARARAVTRFELAPDATLLAWDCVALGRRAGDQPFAHGVWRTDLSVARAGRLVFADRARVVAADPLRASALGWAGHDVQATFVATGPKHSSAMVLAARDIGVAGACGITALSIPDGPPLMLARLLTDTTAAAWAWLNALWAVARPVLLDRAAQPPRIWST